jgi:hypothetical protein
MLSVAGGKKRGFLARTSSELVSAGVSRASLGLWAGRRYGASFLGIIILISEIRKQVSLAFFIFLLLGIVSQNLHANKIDFTQL